MSKKLSLIVCLMFAGCGGLSSQQQTAVGNAVTALRKTEAATQVGVNYANYGQLLVDAKAQVNKVNALLPESELKGELNAAMDAYADVSLAWGDKIQHGDSLYPEYGSGATLIPKYALPKKECPDDPATRAYDASIVMQWIWVIAKDHLDRAALLTDKNSIGGKTAATNEEIISRNKNSNSNSNIDSGSINANTNTSSPKPIEPQTPKEKAAYTKAKMLLERVRKGEDFAKLAKEYSDDPSSKDKGGEYDFFKRGRMVPEFEQVAFSQNPTDVSDIVEAPFGYHIIKTEEYKNRGTPCEEVKVRHILISKSK